MDQLIYGFHHFRHTKKSQTNSSYYHPYTPSSSANNSPCHPCNLHSHVCRMCSSLLGVFHLVSPRGQCQHRGFTLHSWRATRCLPGVRCNAPHGRTEVHSSHQIHSVCPDIQCSTWSASQFRLPQRKQDLDGMMLQALHLEGRCKESVILVTHILVFSIYFICSVISFILFPWCSSFSFALLISIRRYV